MRLGKVDFPEPVVTAARKHELVVFAGAGVSMAKPAGLPGFRELAEEIAGTEEKSEQDIKRVLDRNGPDVYLGRLRDRGTIVHARASEILSKRATDFSELHRVLLSLYPKPDLVRVVTTNFDLLFEQAAKDVFPELAPGVPKTYRFPEFPERSKFRGIVHLHGDIKHPSDMVLTDMDFGAAYLGREPRAQRFVIDLLSTNTLLFVGYSGDDVIFRYLTRGLSSAEDLRHFVMAKVEDEQQWLERGIQPILYPTSSGGLDDALCVSLSRLANIAGESVAKQRSRITELAKRSPSKLDREEADLVADALSDSVRRKFFIRAADSPEWITWLDGRKYLDALFGDEDLSVGDRELAEWLAVNFAHDRAKELFTLIGKHELKLHADFWALLLWQAKMPAESPTEPNCLARWVSLLLSTIPSHIHHGSAVDFFLLGKRCINCGLTDSVAEIFEMLATDRLTSKEFLAWRKAVGELDPGIDVEFSSVAGPHELIELWQKGLQPQLPSIASRLIPILVNILARQHQTLRVWNKASQHWDPTSFHRSAIEPHEQDRYPKAADAVIDAARDCLQWLAKHRRDAALYWWRQLAEEQAPILRRLAVHTLAELPDVSGFGPDEKIEWFLQHAVINDSDVHHEIFRAMRLTYPHASQQCRKAVIDAILTFRLPDEKDPDGGISAYAHFNWLHWLLLSTPGCDLAGKAQKQVLAKHPEFRPRRYPDLEMWLESATGPVGSHSPWSDHQLLTEPADRWVSKLLKYSPEEFLQERGLREQIVSAAQENFGWSADLAEALAADGKWGTGVWGALLQAWAEADEDEILERDVLRHLSRRELSSEHLTAIIDLLHAWARSGKHKKLLGNADCVAAELWPILSRDPDKYLPYTEPSPDWMTSAINCPAGVLAEFWMMRFGVDGLRGKCRAGLSEIVQDLGVTGRLGRTVLARSFSALFNKDEEWARENLLPFFEFSEDKNAKDCQAVWEGFLYRPHLNRQVCSLMDTAFHAAVEQLKDGRHFATEELRWQFLYVCAEIVTDKHLVADPMKKWVPHVLRSCGAHDKEVFVAEIGKCIKRMSEKDREESWNRWVKEYWGLRRDGAIAGPLTRGETTGMFDWLSCLRGGAFKEAVDLAVQTIPMPDLHHGFLFRELGKAGLCEEQPEAMAKLLLYLNKAESPAYEWHEGKKLIRKLWALKIPAALKSQLEDLAALHEAHAVEESVA